MAREAPALAQCKTHLDRLGAGFLGIIGDSKHGYGYHLSRAALLARGLARDYSISGAGDTSGPSDVACAIDVRVTPGADLYGKRVPGWRAAPAFLRWLRVERAAGRLPEVAELIGDANGNGVAMYAADSTGWKWTRYQGSGHVHWFHLAIYRSRANSTTFADRTFGRWTAAGMKKEPTVLNPLELLRRTVNRGFKNLTTKDTALTEQLAAQQVQIGALTERVAKLETPQNGA